MTKTKETKHKIETIQDFQVSVPKEIMEKLGLNPEERYTARWSLLLDGSLNLRFFKKENL